MLYYSITLAIISFFVMVLVYACMRYLDAKHRRDMAELASQRKAFLEKYEGMLTFHASMGKVSNDLYQAHKELIDTLVDEVVIDTEKTKGWKPWPLFMPVKSSIAQPFLLHIKDGQFHFRSFKEECQQYKARKMTIGEVGTAISEAALSLKGRR